MPGRRSSVPPNMVTAVRPWVWRDGLSALEGDRDAATREGESLFDRKPVRIDDRVSWFADVRHLLSPMSGVTDRPFRDLCRRFGMQMGFCEFASASGLMFDSEATWRLVDTEGEDGRVGIQIFGADPEHMGAAARLLSALGLPQDLLGRNPHSLSTGQRRRLALALVLAVPLMLLGGMTMAIMGAVTGLALRTML